MDGVPLDALVTRMLTRSPFDYRVAADDSERGVAYRLRGGAVIDRGWRTADDLPGGMATRAWNTPLSSVSCVGFIR